MTLMERWLLLQQLYAELKAESDAMIARLKEGMT